MSVVSGKRDGFTIVELLIVIVVIGILAAITIVAFNGVQDRAKFTREKSDMQNINKALQLYFAENGTYPIKPAWGGWAQAVNDDFIPGLAPKYIAKTPQMPASSDTNESYLYQSTPTGDGYKLIRYAGTGGLPQVQLTNNPLLDSAIRPTRGWGYWTANAAGY